MKEKTRVATTLSSTIPKGWHIQAHKNWLIGKRQEAVQAAVEHINTLGREKPAALMLQLSYYLILLDDYPSATAILEDQFARTPGHLETALNLAACYSRLDRHDEAVNRANTVLALQPDNIVAWDILAKSLHKLDRQPEASAAGTQVLELRERKSNDVDIAVGWHLPSEHPRNYARRNGKRDVIAFSLWGSHPRYLRGALQNILLAPYFFPGWTLRFYVDGSLPPEFTGLMDSLGAQVIIQPGIHTQRQKLCWRFQVANNPSVGHFLVRDVDSVFGVREV
jgi:tetratricopeptide (TPR) repeat protein